MTIALTGPDRFLQHLERRTADCLAFPADLFIGSSPGFFASSANYSMLLVLFFEPLWQIIDVPDGLDVSTGLRDEFADCKFGDARLDKRILKIADGLEGNPNRSIPQPS